MARMRKTQKARRKRNWKKKKGMRNKSTLNMAVASYNGWNPFPRQYATKLKFSTVVNVTGTVLRSRDHVFRANNLFDPDLTGSGHQPRYFDELGRIYSVYRVLGSKVRAQLCPTNQGTTSQNASLFVIPSNNQVSLSDSSYRDLSELPFSKMKYSNHYNQKNEINHYISTQLCQGVQASVVRTADDYIGTVDGVVTPTKGNFWHIGAALVNEFGTTMDAFIVIDIEYYVIFERPQTPSFS